MYAAVHPFYHGARATGERAGGRLRQSNPALCRSANVVGPDSRRTKRSARSGSRARGAHGDGVDRRELESRRQRSDQNDARRVLDLGDLRAADEPASGRASELAHRGRAVRKGMKPRRDEHRGCRARAAPSRNGCPPWRAPDRGSRAPAASSERLAQRRAVADRGQAARPRAPRCRCARARAAPPSPARTCPAASSSAMSGAVRMIASHGFAREKLVAHRADGAERAVDDRAGVAAKVLRDRPDDSLRGAGGEEHAARASRCGVVTGRPSLRRSSRCAPTSRCRR